MTEFAPILIQELLAVGKKNAISRSKLADLTGLNDRTVRGCINQLRRTQVILSSDDGTGYYIPDLQDPEECERIRLYRVREWSRAMDILHNLKIVDALLDDIKHERLEI